MPPLSPNLPLNLGRATASIPSGRLPRAQNFSVSKLNYQKDISNAKVSVNQLLNKRGVGASDNYYDVDADDKRYDYVRRLAMEKRKEREAAGAENIYSAGIKTGALFKTTGVSGLRRNLIRARYENPAAFKNLSSKDRQYFEDLVKKYVKGVPTGAGIGHHARVAMKQHILRDQRKGVVNVEDAKDFYKMIDALPKVKRGLL